MEVSEIKEQVFALPALPADKAASASERWEYREGGADIIVTRHFTEMENSQASVEFIMLTLYGKQNARQKIIKEFTVALGTPGDHYVDLYAEGHPDEISWVILSPES